MSNPSETGSSSGPGGSGAIRARRLFTGAGGAAVRGADLGSLRTMGDAVLAWEGGVVSYAGPAGGFGGELRIGATAAAVVPGFVECHTHLPFFGWRADEFAARLAGKSYRDLHGERGIYRSARLLAESSDDEVIEFCLPLAAEMLAHGTTALELKTGYGLSVE